MLCPNCNNKLSFFSINKAEFVCPTCNAELLIENNSSVLNVVFLICGLVILPTSVGITGDTFFGIVLGGGVSAIIYFFVAPLFLKVICNPKQKKESEEEEG